MARRGNEPADKRIQPVLLVIGERGPEYQLRRGMMTLGCASENQIVIDDPAISRKHAAIRWRLGRLTIRDLNSTNGTYVNGRRIAQTVRIRQGDEVRIGSKRLRLLGEAEVGQRWRATLRISALVLIVAGFGFTSYEFVGTWMLLLEGQDKAAQMQAGAGFRSATPIPDQRPSGRASGSLTAAAGRADVLAVAPSASAARVTNLPNSTDMWLERLNYFRALVGVPAVIEDPALSQAVQKHARYMVKNVTAFDGGAHTEDPANPWFSAEGLEAAKASDLIPPCSGCKLLTPLEAIDVWIGAPFHRVLLLDPKLSKVGFGEFMEGTLAAYGVYVPLVAGERIMEKPLQFPPDGSRVSFSKFEGEWPNPLASCAGYQLPSGIPITLELGSRAGSGVASLSLTRNGRPVESCGFDWRSYRNANEHEENWARSGMTAYGTVVLIPKEPLRKGASYRVSISANSQLYVWSFSVDH